MTLAQALAFAIIGGTIALFIWDRLRYDLVAVLALLAAVTVGIVPPDKAFSGFSDQIVIIVASALIVSAAVGRSGVVESIIAPLTPVMRSTGMQVAILAGTVTVLSAFMKNIGALAIFIPIAIQIARKHGRSPSGILMPLSFGSLLGGLMTLIGTSPNIIVSRVRGEITGEPFSMFDFTPVGIGLAVIGLAFLTFGWRLLPAAARDRATTDELFKVEDYVSEARVPAGSSVVGRTVGEFEAMAGGDVTVSAIIREKFRRYVPATDWTLQADDILVLEGESGALERILNRAKLELVGSQDADGEEKPARPDDLMTVEAVVTGNSPMVRRSPSELRLRDRHHVNVLAVSRRGDPVRTRLHRLRFQPGDLIVLQGSADNMPDALAELGCLPLAQRNVELGVRRRALVPIVILAAAMLLVALEIAPVTVAFFGAAALMVLFKAVSLKEAYRTVEWPIVVMLGALIPVSDALRTTGATELIAGWLSYGADLLPPAGALALVMVAAMLITPFLNNAATVLVMGPVAASLAQKLGLGVDGFLMAVAIGAACDFLTPIGHQCNTLVMGPGGYRFGDYWRLGLPLSCLVVLAGVPLIVLFWPLR